MKGNFCFSNATSIVDGKPEEIEESFSFGTNLKSARAMKIWNILDLKLLCVMPPRSSAAKTGLHQFVIVILDSTIEFPDLSPFLECLIMLNNQVFLMNII